jgi:polar amino acid transport system ATP-binding protein
VDLAVDAGEVVAIIGPSGSGKSTLLRCINLMETPTGGSISVAGEVVCSELPSGRMSLPSSRRLRELRTEIGMVFQHFNLFPHMTVLQNITEAPMSVRGLTRTAAEADAIELLTQVGLADKAKAYPSQLSGGQRQRVAIARALAMKPRIMLFDEVTSAVDPEMAGEILFVMRQLARGGMTMLVVTHEMKFASEVADRVVFLDAGRIEEIGTPAQVLNHPSSPRTQKFLRAVVDREPMDAASLGPSG